VGSRIHLANLVSSPEERPTHNLSPRSDRLSPVLSHDFPGVGITTYRQGGFIHLKTGLMENLIPRNTPEIPVSRGWSNTDGQTGWENYQNRVLSRIAVLW